MYAELNFNRVLAGISSSGRGFKRGKGGDKMVIKEIRWKSSTMEMVSFVVLVHRTGMLADEIKIGVWRDRSIENIERFGKKAPFGEWKINFDSYGSGTGTYEEKLPFVAALNAAMRFLKKQKGGTKWG